MCRYGADDEGNMNEQSQLGYLSGKALRGEPLDDNDFRTVESFVADNAEAGVQANSILAIAGNAEQRSNGFKGLRRICEQPGICHKGLAVACLLNTLEILPMTQLRTAYFIDLVHEAAKHPFLGARINAMRVLRRLAKRGDQKAIQLLRDGTKDAHSYVSATAQASLRLAGIDTGRSGN